MDYHFPVLALVDLTSARDMTTVGDLTKAIERCKLRPHTSQIPIYAFDNQVDTVPLQGARKAGPIRRGRAVN